MPDASRPLSPEHQDDALAGLARTFFYNPPDPTPGSEALDREQLDFSIDSLKAVDHHLERMRSRSMDQRAWNSFILRAGAYVGEVIRRHAMLEWHWLSYTQAAEISPYVASLGMSIESAAVLWNGGEGFTFPCAKVGKFLQNGPEDSVLFYALVIIAGPPPDACRVKSEAASHITVSERDNTP